MIVETALKISVLTVLAFFTNRFFTRLLESKKSSRNSLLAFIVYIVLIDFFVLGNLVKEFLDVRAATLLQHSLIYFLQITISQLCILLIVHAFFKGNIFKKLAICSVYFVIWEVVGYVVSTPLSWLVAFLTDETGAISTRIFSFIPSTLKYAVICMLLNEISKRCEHLCASLPRKVSAMLFVPSLFILFILELVMLVCGDLQVFHRLSYSMQLANPSVFLNVVDISIVCVAAILGLLANIMLVFGVNDAMKQAFAAAGLQMQVDHYRDLQEGNQKLQALRHDMKNHFIVLSGLLAANELTEAKEYINNLTEESGLSLGGIQTGNVSVDALIGTKQMAAENHDVKFECDVKIPQLTDVSDFDLCVILGNALDNALEACEKIQNQGKPFIAIESCVVKDYLIIEIKNSTVEKELTCETLTSAKANTSIHGIGLINIKTTVEKHFGAMDMKCENYIFNLSVMLPLNRT